MSNSEKIKFKFFKIKYLGYYNHENSSSFPHYSDILEQLNLWAKSQGAIINTECYEKDTENNIYGTYFYNYHEFNNKKDGILILWNELENTNGGVFSIDQFTKPGEGKIEKTSLDTNSIPGKPSYYWFNFDKNIIVSIILETSISKKENLERYIYGFLKNHSKYKISSHEDDLIKITNYIDPNAETQLLFSSYPLVKFTTQRNNNIKSDILRRYKEITKLITKEKLLWRKKDHRQRIEKFLSSIFTTPPKLSGQKTFKQEISFKPTLKQVKEIIKNFEQHATEKSISDIGFKLKDQTILMLSGSNFSTEISTTIVYQEDGFASLKSLTEAIDQNKYNFLHQLESIQPYEYENEDEIENCEEKGVTLDLFPEE